MNFPLNLPKRISLLVIALSASLLVFPAPAEVVAPAQAKGEQPDAKPDLPKAAATKGAGKWEAAGVSKREWKTQKRERQQEDMLKRVENRANGGPPRRVVPPPAPASTVANPSQQLEDFDWSVPWEQKDNRAVHSAMDYGYSGTNHLAAAGCAPGEIGGSVNDNGLSWFADKVSGRSALDPGIPTAASGSCVFTATGGAASVGWFNSDTYTAPHVVPDAFIGWRQDGATLRAALGHTGSSLIDGTPLAITKGAPFQWALRYTPTGGANGCGEIALTVGGSSSTLALTKQQREALSARKFNRFGIVTGNTGRQTSTLWLDNLSYTRIAGFPVPHPDATAHTRSAFFDTDATGSTFFAVNNLSPHEPVTVTQDYGYRFADGRSGGCVGGRFTQAIGTSHYGYDYGEKMLHFTDKLRAEGWFQVPSYEGRAAHLGWTSKLGKSWHEPSTLGLRISSINIKGQGRRVNISAEGTMQNHEGHGGAGWGTVLTIPAGPEWHHYAMEFDPAGGHGLGSFAVEVDGVSKLFYFGEEKLKVGADIDLFGMWNAKIPAEDGALTVYLDDVTNTTNGRRDPASNDFNGTPAGWVGRNNSFTAKDYVVRPYHQFGWAGSLAYLDGLNGYSPMYTIPASQRYCMGGIIYLASYENLHVPRASYGAGLNGTLNAKAHHLYVTGRFKLDWANVDAAELVGWYNSETACDETLGGKGHILPDKFLGFAIHGGSNGYGMIPSYRSPHLPEEQMLEAWNPATRVYQDGEWREFYMEYDPDGAGGRGQLKLQLSTDGTPVIQDLKEGAKGAGFAFDRFGLLTMRKGGGKPHAIYFDKLTYTVAP
jgi:hypothetical protein